ERNARSAQLGGKFSGFAVKKNRRTSSRLAAYFHIAPTHSVVPSCTNRFHRSFFCGEAGGVAFDAISFGVAIGALTFGVNTLKQAVPVTLDGFRDAGNFGDVNAGTDDHLGLR